MYEIGDKVIYQGADKSAYKKVGVLKSIEEKDGKPQLTVEFEGGETFTAPVDDWSREFTNAVRNAKFKVGDKVIVDEKEAVYGGLHGKVTDVDGSGYVGVKITDKNKYNADFVRAKESLLRLANSRACRSTNSVVRNAMVANRRVARNAESPEDYDGNMHQVISLIAYDLEKTVLQLGKAVSLWEKADKSEYAKGEVEKSLALDRRLYSLVTGALQYMRKAEQASA